MHSVTPQEALWKTDKTCWNNMSHHVLHELVESIPAQEHVVIETKGGT